MAKKTKYYVVWQGNNPGVYDSWDECLLQVKGYPNALYRSFSSREEAEEAYAHGYTPVEKPGRRDVTHGDLEDEVVWNSICVDAACSGNPGLMEYRGVDTRTGLELFHVGPLQDGTNNIGEFLALVHALAYLKRKGDEETVIYSDSRIAIGWVKKGKARTKLNKTKANTRIFELIERAEKWLQNTRFKTQILKWDTARLGEIPADFGRK